MVAKELINVLRDLIHELRRFNDSMPYFRQNLSRIEQIQEARQEEHQLRRITQKEITEVNEPLEQWHRNKYQKGRHAKAI